MINTHPLPNPPLPMCLLLGQFKFLFELFFPAPIALLVLSYFPDGAPVHPAQSHPPTPPTSSSMVVRTQLLMRVWSLLSTTGTRCRSSWRSLVASKDVDSPHLPHVEFYESFGFTTSDVLHCIFGTLQVFLTWVTRSPPPLLPPRLGNYYPRLATPPQKICRGNFLARGLPNYQASYSKAP